MRNGNSDKFPEATRSLVNVAKGRTEWDPANAIVVCHSTPWNWDFNATDDSCPHRSAAYKIGRTMFEVGIAR